LNVLEAPRSVRTDIVYDSAGKAVDVIRRAQPERPREGIDDPPLCAEMRSVTSGWRQHDEVVIGLHVGGRIVRYALRDKDVAFLIASLPEQLEIRRARLQKRIHSESESGNPSALVSPAEQGSQ
jgi:hypothetical protein